MRPLAGAVYRVLAWLREPLPPPPAVLRRGPFRAGAFRDGASQGGGFSGHARSPRLASQLGIALAVSFAICLVTGLLDHLLQNPPGWFSWPSRPVAAFRVTQGLHVATGLATIPLLGVKLWSVYPRLFQWPPARDAAHALERLGVLVLVAAALFQLVTGLLNISLWYAPMPFYFPSAHHWTAWLAAGAILVHSGVKLPVVREALGRGTPRRTPAPSPGPAGAGPPLGAGPPAGPWSPPGPPVAGSPVAGSLSRRQLLAATTAAAGVITVATAGQTVAPLARASVLAPRVPHIGPQGVPVNRSAAAARVGELARDPAYGLMVIGPGAARTLSLDALAALPQHTASLPIACVEGWSADARWTGVRLSDLVRLVGVDPAAAEVDAESLEAVGLYRRSTLPPSHTADPLTLVALRLHGEPLHLDHGYPARLIAPNRPGVQQTKWLARLVVRARR